MSEEIRAKDIVPHKTSFGPGDGFYGDGNTSFFMEAENFLELTAQHTLGSIHGLDTTATDSDLVSGNYIAIDSANGLKKLDAKTLMGATVKNTEKDISELRSESLPTTGTISDAGIAYVQGEFISKDTGGFAASANSMRTGLVALVDYVGKTFSITASAGAATCIFAVYDGNQHFLNSYGKDPEQGEYHVVWYDRKVTYSEILAENPTAKYIAFSSWPTNTTVDLSVKLFTNKTTQEAIDGLEESIDELDERVDNLDEKVEKNIPTSGTIESLGLEYISGAFVDGDDGSLVEYSQSKHTDYIALEDYSGVIFCITATAGFQTCIYALYDENKNFLDSYGRQGGGFIDWEKEKVSVDSMLTAQPTAKYVRFSSWPTYRKDLLVEKWVQDTVDTLAEKLKARDPLYGKKWVACGDSYTEATNLSSDFDPEMGIYKSYAWWITKRTGCNLDMMARSGERIHNDPNSTNKFTPDRYKTIPLDADIITLAWGLNEVNVEIGNSSSSDNTTLWGAFNEVIGWILTNIPSCKIGIIIEDGMMPTRIANAEKAIGEYWGVPVLDLKYDKNVPLGISGSIDGIPQVRPNTSSLAQDQRNAAFADATIHPNASAHKYRSTFIEAWLKTL